MKKRNNLKQLFLAILLILLSVTIYSSFGCAKKTEPPKPQGQQQQTKPPETAEQSAAVPVSSSEKPEACASCHANDNNLTATVKKVEGHPPVQADTVKDCAGCHKTSGYPKLSEVIHKSHKGEKNIFVSKYKGSCVHCHKQAENGEIFIPGLASTVTKSVTIEVYQVDKAPGGCLDCHKDTYSIPNTIKKISGHPAVNFEDFNNCYNCHGKTAPQLGNVLHKGHLGKDTYKKNYGNSCLNCHKPTEDAVILKGKK